jgi:hypothetical protein
VPAASKKPVLKEWQALRLDDTSVGQHFNGEPQNLGLLLGEASDGLVDADLDCREAVILADRFLPDTAVKFGRKSTGASHWIWRVVGPRATVKFQDAEKGPDGERAMLVELRADGCQTIVPPSIHPSGERVTFLCHDFTPGEVDGGELLRRGSLLAVACILGRHWPAEGGRHRPRSAPAVCSCAPRCRLRTWCASSRARPRSPATPRRARDGPTCSRRTTGSRTVPRWSADRSSPRLYAVTGRPS